MTDSPVDILAGLSLIGGAAFAFIAALGLFRLQDVFLRMHAATKAGTLGAGLTLAAVCLYFGDLAVVTRGIATIAFLFLTAPVAAHLIGRAAYNRGVPLWSGTVVNECPRPQDRSPRSR